MKKLLISFVCCLIISLRLYSQQYCEIDKVFTSFDREVGCRIIRTSDGNFVTLSISGQNGRMKVEIPKFVLTKLDTCGIVLWRKYFDYCYSCSSNISDLREDEDGSIIWGGYLHVYSKDSVRKDLRLYKTTQTGQLTWALNFGDSTKDYDRINSTKLSSNRYLFTGSFRSIIPEGQFPFLLIIDTLGNNIFHENYSNQTGIFFSAQKITYNNYAVFGRLGNNYIILNIDSNGNKINNKSIPWIRAFEPFYMAATKGCNQILYVASSPSNQTLVAKLDMNGNLLKDSLLNFDLLTTKNYIPQTQIYITMHDGLLFPGYKMSLIDSNFRLNWFDENQNSPREAFSFTLLEDMTLVSTGRGNGRSDATMNVVYDYWFGSKSISTIAKTIYLQGRDIINIKHDTLQVSASVLPSTTINKTVLWVVNDTNLASISQTGLVRAKANGEVTVTASTTDGSNLSAQKVITITNQTVGLEANAQLLQNLRVYPNPAKDYFEIDKQDADLKTLEILDLSGSVLQTIDAGNCNSPCIYSTKELSNGIYFLRIHSSHGVVVKKFAVYR